MKKVCLSLVFIVLLLHGTGQTLTSKLQSVFRKLESDPQMKHGIMSLYVIDAKTGKAIFQKNEQLGLAPASTQKLVTSAAAFEMLGSSFRYKTELSYSGNITSDGILDGNLYLTGSGDPTLGSWRWKETREEILFLRWVEALKSNNIRSMNRSGELRLINENFSENRFPDGWIWQDIGNYYGAQHGAINWRENQFDIKFNPGPSVGDPVKIISTSPGYLKLDSFIHKELVTGLKGSGDNAYVYLSPTLPDVLFISGTLPLGEKNFSISAAHPNPMKFISSYINHAAASGDSVARVLQIQNTGYGLNKPGDVKVIDTYLSPPLDSINYWFLKRSINLYGEALIKTIAVQKEGFGSTDRGVELIRDFWAENGIEKSSLHIVDGSGLSPQNRLTTSALVHVLKYAKTTSWFGSFYNALPEINGLKMKSGSIGGARAYAGYHKNKSGAEYIFAIMVNNYDGSSASIVRKMFGILDVLK